MKHHKASSRFSRGFSLIEILVVVAIIGLVLAIVMPMAGKMIRRARATSATSSVSRLLTQARLNAIRRGFPVVVKFSWNATTHGLHILSFEDHNGSFEQDTYTPPGGAAVNETVLGEFDADRTFIPLLHGQALTTDPAGNMTTAVAFSGYTPPAVVPPGSTFTPMTTDPRIVFLPNGALLPGDSLPPTSAGGRGVYIADEKGRNFFRVTIPSNTVAKVRVDKWVDSTTGYSPNNWTWF